MVPFPPILPTLLVATLAAVRLGGVHPTLQPAPQNQAPTPGPVLPPRPAQPPAAASSAPKPGIQILADIRCGTVLAGTFQGSLVLGGSAGGNRTAQDGIQLAEGLPWSAGAFTLSGQAGAGWTLCLTGGARTVLAGPDGPKPWIPLSSVVLGPQNLWTGVLPPGPGTVTKSSPIKVGLAVQVPASARPGIYTGSLPLLMRDASGNMAQAALQISLQVQPQPLAVRKVADLSFGTVLVGASSGKVVLAPFGAVTSSGGVTAVRESQTHPADFLVTGSPGTNFSIALPDQAVLDDAHGHKMNVTDFTHSHHAHPHLDGDANAKVKVGATLHTAVGQPAGHYQGSFVLLVTYD